MTDVQRAPRLIAWLVLMRMEGIQAEGKGKNPINSTGVQRKTPRFVAWFECFLVLEKSKIDGSDSTGDQMKVPRVVASTPRVQALC